MTDDKLAKQLERVRALLAKAASTPFPEEADAFRAKADELMTAYSIDAYMVQMAQEGTQRTIKPEVRWMELDWWNRNADIYRTPLWWMFNATARHCRVEVVQRKESWLAGGGLREPLVGLPADLDYFDLLFTNLMMDMIGQVDPQPKAEEDLIANCQRMRMAGLDWFEITRRLVKAGMVEDPQPATVKGWDGEERPHPYGERWVRDGGWKHNHPERYRLSERLGSQTRAAAKANGWRTDYPHVKTFRRNFAEGYEDQVSMRLRAMSRASREAFDKGHEAGSMALAVRDIASVVKAKVYEEWPDLAPHDPECECDACHARKCTDPNCKRPRCVAKRKPVRVRRAPEYTYDHSARQAGRAAGEKVALENNPSRRVGGSGPALPR